MRQADIVVTATTAREPVLAGEWLRPGTHVNAMGSNWHNRREVDEMTLERCDLIAVDAMDQAQIEAGDLLIPAGTGHFDMERVVELGSIVAGTVPVARRSRVSPSSSPWGLLWRMWLPPAWSMPGPASGVWVRSSRSYPKPFKLMARIV